MNQRQAAIFKKWQRTRKRRSPRNQNYDSHDSESNRKVGRVNKQMSQVITRRRGSQIIRKEKSKRIRGSIYEVSLLKYVGSRNEDPKSRRKKFFKKSWRRRRKIPELEHVNLGQQTAIYNPA